MIFASSFLLLTPEIYTTQPTKQLTQPNPWVDPTHGQLCYKHPVTFSVHSSPRRHYVFDLFLCAYVRACVRAMAAASSDRLAIKLQFAAVVRDYGSADFNGLYVDNGRLRSRVVSVLDSGAEGPGFKSQPRRCRVTVLDKLFTPIVPLFTKQRNW